MSIKILVADDHEVVRSGLTHFFKGTNIEIVGEACDGNQAVKLTKKLRPDVVLMESRLPECDGLAALKKIRSESSQARVVMFSTYDNPTYIARSVALEAVDYVLKSSTQKELLTAIHHAAKGESPSKDSIFFRIQETMNKRREAGDEDNPLTNRELQVLRHLAFGLCNREVGLSLGLSVETVKEHVQNILRKINVKCRTQAAVWAVRRGII